MRTITSTSCRSIWHRWGSRDAFVTGGGYKYCQLGEGNAFLRVPPECMRPVLTGWFARSTHSRMPRRRRRATATAPPLRGGTYDPTSHYRAAAVFAFHEEQGLTADRLRQISRRQVALLRSQFEALDVSPGGRTSSRCPTIGEADSSPSGPLVRNG